MAHTYAVHLSVAAESDAEAIAVARYIQRRLEYPRDVEVLATRVTDDDDWDEHIALDLGCEHCGEPVDRERVGTGKRHHHACGFSTPYPIEDVSR